MEHATVHMSSSSSLYPVYQPSASGCILLYSQTQQISAWIWMTHY